MPNVTAYEIKEALAKKHGNREFFITECKNGPTGVAAGELLQFDGVAIYKSWSHPQIRGYEIKISRSDFLRDAKYPCYLPYFHEFYFVVPAGMVQKQEVDESIGLMWYNPKNGAITTKKRAVWRNIEIDPMMLWYIIMTRLDSERAPFMLHKEEAFRAWLDGKESNRELARRVKSKLLEDNAKLEAKVRELEALEEAKSDITAIRKVLAKHGIASFWNDELCRQLDGALSGDYPKELDEIRERVQNALTLIDRFKFRTQKLIGKTAQGEQEATCIDEREAHA